MQEIRVSHAVVIDESWRVYFDQNPRLKWLTLLWWKYEDWEDDETCIQRELPEEGGFSLEEAISVYIIRVNEVLEDNQTRFIWVTRAIKISDRLWEKISEKDNVVRMPAPEVLFKKDDFAEIIDYSALVDKIIDSTFILNKEMVWN